MALVNVHPDYIAFGGEPDTSSSYPVARYVEFLTWVKERYAGEYWQPRPMEIANLIRSIALAKANLDRDVTVPVDVDTGMPR